MKTLGILTSGGDCPGLNAVISSVVKTGIPLGYRFLGFERGWEGVLSPCCYRELDNAAVRGIAHLGGTFLKTTNRGRFGAKVGEGGVRRIPDDVLLEAKNNLAAVGCDGLIVIGGDGSLAGALQLAEHGVNVVGVPKTIDNDLSATDRTFGFSTAVQVAVDAIDRIHTTAYSHDRVILVETMGRHAGWIAIRAGLAGGADAILLPEFEFTVPDLVKFLRERKKRIGSAVIVVAEGAKIAGQLVGEHRAESEAKLGGIGNRLMDEIHAVAGEEFELRGAVLGHVQRGGTPSAADRILAKAYGVGAMEAYHAGHFGCMVAYRNQAIVPVPIGDATGSLKVVDESALEYRTARRLGVFMH